MKFLIVFFGLAFIVIILLLRVKIKWRTFFKRGFLPKRKNFGLYCFCGTMGNGKTYSLSEYVYDNYSHVICYSNVHSLKINGVKIHYFTGFKELLKIIDDYKNGFIEIPKGYQFVVVFDELFTELTKNIKVEQKIVEFLAYLRKFDIIMLTTCQFWSELPISFRRFCRYQIQCKMLNFFFIGILWKRFRDAENMKWDDREQDFVAPLVENTFSKCRIAVAKSFNTKEVIDKSSSYSLPKSNSCEGSHLNFINKKI